MNKTIIKPTVLIVMDGIGVSESKKGNAVYLAKTPCLDDLWAKYPHGCLNASGLEVGLSWGMMGGSEVGHLNMGSGRVVYQGIELINRIIATDKFFKNSVLKKAANHANKYNSDIHLMGLLSVGGVHSTIEHLQAILRFLKKEKVKNNVYLHLFTDGRDMPPQSGPILLNKLKDILKGVKIGSLGTMIGRFYAMDRDNRWERTEQAYRLLTEGKGDRVSSFEEALEKSYQNKVFDEFIGPKLLIKKSFWGKEKEVPLVKENDVVIFFNFRADRARQLTKAFVLNDFEGFKREKLKNLFFATMTEYEKGLPVEVIIPIGPISKTLAEVLSEHKLKQLHIGETEKYAHVTFFFNGKREKAFPGEERILVPSPKVENYAQKPEMSAYEINRKLVEEIKKGIYSFIIVNYANGDMVGHTGNLEAAIKGVEVVDKCVKEVTDLVLFLEGKLLITADHGNCEEMINLQTGEPIVEHSENLVPFIVVVQERKYRLGEEIIGGEGILSDVTPTILKLMNIKPPKEMTGHPLIQ